MNEDEARLNITIGGQNGDLAETVSFDANDADIKTWATEAIRTGSVPGIPATPNADFTDFVVERFASNAERPATIMLRPKTPFGI